MPVRCVAVRYIAATIPSSSRPSFAFALPDIAVAAPCETMPKLHASELYIALTKHCITAPTQCESPQCRYIAALYLAYTAHHITLPLQYHSVLCLCPAKPRYTNTFSTVQRQHNTPLPFLCPNFTSPCKTLPSPCSTVQHIAHALLHLTLLCLYGATLFKTFPRLRLTLPFCAIA